MQVKKSTTTEKKVEVICMCNSDIKEYAQKKNVRLWRIASELGINDGNFSRKLRHELPEDTKKQIFKIIDELAAM